MERKTPVGLKSPENATPRPAPTGFEGKGGLDDAVRDLITSYHALNPSTIDELDEEPSPLEFMRHVSRNRPFVIRNGASTWTARKSWNTKYLTAVMGQQPVNVAKTPHGNADSILSLSDHDTHLLFVKPHETSEPFSRALHAIQTQELRPEDYHGPTRYAQTQNDNLRNEYSTLFADVPNNIPFVRIALEKEPDAINFWLGNSKSTTALHKDNYENIYVQVLGQKHFVLLPPVESACVNEKSVLAATYAPRPQNGSKGESEAGGDGNDEDAEDLVVCVDEPEEYVPFATWDPDTPTQRSTPFSQYSRPLRVTLDEGDMLYLPALWYHKVSQSCSVEGICCAVNYWYDLDFGGSFWAMASFSRGVGLLSLRGEEENENKEGVEA